jgi:dolichol-phosphate mannosyltransferase
LKALVIIPTFNEKENISSIIQAVFSQSPPFHVLVIDDGSPDGTAVIVKQLQEINSDRLFLIERTGKLGLGTAYILGFQWAIQMGYDFVFEMDADFSHNPNDLPRLLQACINGADVAIGSRYVPGGKIENWPLDRHIYSKGGAFYTRLITGIPVKDPTAGFVCYRRTALEAIDLPTIQFIGYAFQIEMKFKAWKLGLKIVEVPIVFVDRKAGASKMTKGIIQEGVIGVWKMHQENKKQQ